MSSTNLEDDMTNFHQIQLATHKHDTQLTVTRLNRKNTKESMKESQAKMHTRMTRTTSFESEALNNLQF